MSVEALVLVTDDDEDIRDTVALVLEDAGYRVIVARDGAEALSLARVRRPALIILDLMMPTMDGLEFREHQLRDPALADIPVLLFTAGMHDPARTPGIAGFIAKPVRLSDLLDAVAAHARP